MTSKNYILISYLKNSPKDPLFTTGVRIEGHGRRIVQLSQIVHNSSLSNKIELIESIIRASNMRQELLLTAHCQ